MENAGSFPPGLIARGEEADPCISHSNVRKTLINATTELKSKSAKGEGRDQSVLPMDLYTDFIAQVELH